MGEQKRRQQFYGQPPHQHLGDAPVEAAYHAKMTAIMRTLDEFMNDGAKGDARKTGIVVMVFPFGEGATTRCNYMSNGDARRDIVTLMKEMIARFEGQPEITGHG